MRKPDVPTAILVLGIVFAGFIFYHLVFVKGKD